ncbi:MAG: hypothetical protein Q9172_002341 [Xanthocarpia lactea]
MSPAIHSFPARHFYDGELVCHPDTDRPTDDKNRLQKSVPRLLYGIKGESDQKNGLEAWLINVCRGAARVEPNCTSLQNHANADVISLLVGRLLAAGIAPSDIVLLTMYKAQMKLVASKIERTEDGGVTWHDISTVDAFQGKQRSVVIFDLIVAKAYEYYEVYNVNSQSAQSQQDQQGKESAVEHVECFGSRHALPRAAHHDKEHIDTHLVAIEEREAMSEAEKKRLEALTSDENRFKFINKWVKKGHTITHNKTAAPNELFGTKADPNTPPQP